MPSEEKNIMQLASLQSVYSITVAQCYGMDFVPFELTANCLALFFFRMVPELNEEAFRNRKEDLVPDSL